MTSIILKTKRLELLSGSLEHARAEKYDQKRLPKLLNAAIPDNWPPPLNDEESINFFLKYLEDDPDAGGFTSWYILLPEGSKKKAIGNIGFKGMPDESGTVEIGYSIMETHHHNGYASEAVAAIVDWAFSQPKVLRVIAETLPELVTSQRVLEKNGFKFIGEGSEPGIIRYELQNKRIKT
ncbi:MAG: GNAT family N-acetyltransferase [Ignavibacteriales bacterium]|nr:GNAT family N-acetyltransferase [Ignavibacteriales bacterium]